MQLLTAIPHSASCTNGMTRKLFRVMKLTAFFLLIACLAASASGHSQNITIRVKDAPLTQVLSEIEKQSGINFVYGKGLIEKAGKISLQVKDQSLSAVLELVFKNQPLDYKVTENYVVLSPKQTVALQPTGTPPNETFLTTTIDVSGKVMDADGNPLAGASVKVKGTTIGTTTNADGVYVLKGIDENAVLEFSYAEHETIELKVGSRTTVTAALKRNNNPLDEIQVIAYGTNSKRYQIGNVSTVNAKDIAKQPVSNPLLALAGRVPGLFITQSKGLPGSGVNVVIQGQNSINRGNDPFYVIDGVPYTSQLLTNYGSILGTSGTFGSNGNPLSFLNPADIESISVLKDADATAIYGSRGANGVILITTKKGKAGQTKVDVNMQTGWGKVTRKLDLLNTEQYLEMRREAKRNDNATIDPWDYDLNGLWDTTRYTDWQKELIGNTAHYTDMNATVSGGTMNTQVLAGVGYHKETTVFPGSLADERGSLHFSIINSSTNQKFRMQLTGNYLEDNNRIISRDITQDAITLAPNAPKIYNDDGSLNWMPDATGTSTWTNPLAYFNDRYKNQTKNLVGNAVVSYQLTHSLGIKSSFGYTNLQSNEVQTFPLITKAPERRLTARRNANFSYNNISSWIIEPQISYNTKFGNSRLEALVGSTIQQNNTNGLRLITSGYNSDVVLEDVKSASSVSILSTVNTAYKYNAFFSRLSYNLLDKYLVNLTARRDGSSRFGPGNQFHNFGALGLGWIFSKETFIQKALPFLSFGKLSASYGTTGNDQIGDYQFMTLYSPPSFNVGVPYQSVTGLQPNGLSNAFLQWEETKKIHFGLDLGLFNESVLVTAGYFKNRSGNQLLNYLLPIQTGFSSIYKNLPATVQNSGWEFALSTTNIKTKNFSWSTDVNVTIPKNELLEFPGIEATGYSNLYTVGQPITIQKAFQFAGVDPTTGVYQFLDSKGNLTSYPDFSTDQTVLINTAPTLYGGITNNVRYKSLELDFLFQFVRRKGSNYVFGDYSGAFFNVNQPVSFLDRWQKTGDNTSSQKYYSDFSLSDPSESARNSDAGYSDASFARLKNLSLSWRLPESWYKRVKLNNARLYIQGQNLLTITNYIGLDPETLSSTTLPPLKVLTVGLQLGL